MTEECGEGGAEYEQIMEKLRQDIEINSKLVTSFHRDNSLLFFVICSVCNIFSLPSWFIKFSLSLSLSLSLSPSDLSAVKGSLPFFRKSLEKMHSTRKCPLCTRGFDDHASFERTVKSVSGW